MRIVGKYTAQKVHGFAHVRFAVPFTTTTTREEHALIDQYFQTLGLTGGVLLILGVGILIFLLVAVFLEMRTRKAFPERKKRSSSDSLFSFGDDDDDD